MLLFIAFFSLIGRQKYILGLLGLGLFFQFGIPGIIAGIVLTGGGSQLKHIKQLVEYITGMDTRVGYPNEHLAGDTDKDVTIPLFATAVGLVLDGLKRFEKDINEKVGVKETSSEDAVENESEQESEVRTERPGFLDSFKDKLTEFLDNAE